MISEEIENDMSFILGLEQWVGKRQGHGWGDIPGGTEYEDAQGWTGKDRQEDALGQIGDFWP